MAWATEQEVTTTSPQSHLLLILASFANEFNVCYPSISTMMKKTRLAEKTVKKALKELIELNLISDTKTVSNFNTKVYKLHLEVGENGGCNFAGGADLQGGKSTPTPPVNLPSGGCKFTAEPPVNLPPNPVINPINNPIIEPVSYETHTHETQADENHQNAKKPKTTSSVKKTKSSDNKLTADDLMNLKLSDFNFSNDDFNNIPNLGNWLFNDLDYQVVKDYIATRKTKLTITAVKMIVKQSALANINLNSALEFCIESGWQSFKADWYFNRQQPRQTHFNQQPTNRMDELRQLAQNAPVNEFGDFPFEQNFHQPATIGVNHE